MKFSFPSNLGLNTVAKLAQNLTRLGKSPQLLNNYPEKPVLSYPPWTSSNQRIVPRKTLALFIHAIFGASLLIGTQQVVVAATCTSVGGTLSAPANWSATGTWSGCGGVVPTNIDDVTINDATAVTLNVSGDAKSVTINAGGTLTSTSTNNILTVAGNFTNNTTYESLQPPPPPLPPLSVTFSTVAATVSGATSTKFDNLTANVSLTLPAVTTPLATIAGNLTIAAGTTIAGVVKFTSTGASSVNHNINVTGDQRIPVLDVSGMANGNTVNVTNDNNTTDTVAFTTITGGNLTCPQALPTPAGSTTSLYTGGRLGTPIQGDWAPCKVSAHRFSVTGHDGAWNDINTWAPTSVSVCSSVAGPALPPVAGDDVTICGITVTLADAVTPVSGTLGNLTIDSTLGVAILNVAGNKIIAGATTKMGTAMGNITVTAGGEFVGTDLTDTSAVGGITVTGNGKVTLSGNLTIGPTTVAAFGAGGILTVGGSLNNSGTFTFDAGSTVKLTDADHSIKIEAPTTIPALDLSSLTGTKIISVTGTVPLTVASFILPAVGAAVKVTASDLVINPLPGGSHINSTYQATTAGGTTFSCTNCRFFQTIIFTPPTNATVGDMPLTLSATGGASGNAVTFASTSTDVCTLSEKTLKIVRAGTCIVTANQAGNAIYHEASVSQKITITDPLTNISVTPPLPPMMALFIQVDGTGSGSVSTDSGLYCTRQDCQANSQGEVSCNQEACRDIIDTGTTVTLTTKADSGSVFTSWGGHEDCIDGKINNFGRLCIAFFQKVYDLTVISGQGKITNSDSINQPQGIECGEDGTKCSDSFSYGSTTYLQATSATNLTFLGWGGDCQGLRNPLTVKVLKEMTCEAQFGPEAPLVTLALASTSPIEVTALPAVITPEPVMTLETTPTVATAPTTAVTITPAIVTEVPVMPVTPTLVTVIPAPVTATPALVTVISTPVTVIPVPVTATSVPVIPTTPAPVILIQLPILGGSFSSCDTTVCNYGGHSVTELDIQGQGMISNGILSSTLVNLGWVSNFTITVKGKLTGGVVTGYIKNDGIMLDFDFKGMSIIGGTLGGVITNTSKVGGFFQDVTLLAGTKITGGTLKGTIKGDKKSPALLENVRVKKGSKLSGVKLGKDVKLEKGVVVD